MTHNMSDPKQSLVKVAVAVIIDRHQRILVAKRFKHQHQGGLWEFPGGKLEANETITQALKRELKEELDIEIHTSRPLIDIKHHYPDQSVQLLVHRVHGFSGLPKGAEGQDIKWQPINTLAPTDFPAANRPIINALQLPDCYMITPPPTPTQINEFLAQLETRIQSGMTLIQLRFAPNTLAEHAHQIYHRAKQLTQRHSITCLVNSRDYAKFQVELDGLHLTSQDLMALESRPIAYPKRIAASCHSLAQLQHASDIGVDFAVLSPIETTTSHPNATPLGWPTFEHWVSQTPLPIYALGGMQKQHIPLAIDKGGQGCAGIRGFWSC